MPEGKLHGQGLRIIAAFKLLKACSLIALGVGALKLLHRDVAAVVEHWINMLQVDPRNHFINLLLTKLSNFDDRRLKALSVGTFIYAGIFLQDRKSTRLNSSHGYISYAVFCLKKKNIQQILNR